MFKITAIQDKTRQKEICELCGVEFREDSFAYLLYDIEDGHTMGMSQFEILGERGYIFDLRSAPGVSDFEAMFILGRQTMNFIDLCGSHICQASSDAGDKSLLSAIGFKEHDGAYIANMEGMFSGHCSGECK